MLKETTELKDFISPLLKQRDKSGDKYSWLKPTRIRFKNTHLIFDSETKKPVLLGELDTDGSSVLINLSDHLKDYPVAEHMLHQNFDIADFDFFVTDQGNILVEETSFRKWPTGPTHLLAMMINIEEINLFLYRLVGSNICNIALSSSIEIISTMMDLMHLTVSYQADRFGDSYLVKFSATHATCVDYSIPGKERPISVIFSSPDDITFFGAFSAKSLKKEIAEIFDQKKKAIFTYSSILSRDGLYLREFMTETFTCRKEERGYKMFHKQ